MTRNNEIFLHIGFPKTGTKTIQRFCFQNRAIMAQHGILYPTFDDSINLGFPESHFPLTIELMETRPPHLAGMDSEALRSAFNTLFETYRDSVFRKLIISEETISQGGAIDLARLARAMEGSAVTVVIYVRQYDEWLESFYNWYLANAVDRNIRNFNEFPPRRFMERLLFSNRIDAIRQLLPDCHYVLKSYDSVRKELLDDFLHVCGMSDILELRKSAAEFGRENVGLSRGDSLFLAQVVATIGDRDVWLKVAETLAAKARSGELSPLAELNAGQMDVETRSRARALYNADVKILEREYGLKATPAEPLSDRDRERVIGLSALQMKNMIDFISGELASDEVAVLKQAVIAAPAEQRTAQDVDCQGKNKGVPMGAVHFSLDPDLVAALKGVLPLPAMVETGTFHGDTPLAMAEKFSRIVTVELSEELHKSASERLREHDHIKVIKGSSPEALQGLRKELADESVLYFLDAHWCLASNTAGDTSQCPLLDELAAIGQLNDTSVILIDDARLFLTTPPEPHEASDWPRLHQILASLMKLSSVHEVQVINDVIAFVPPAARAALSDHARQKGIDWLHVLNSNRADDSKIAATENANAKLKETIASLNEVNGNLRIRIQKLQRQLETSTISRISKSLRRLLPAKKT